MLPGVDDDAPQGRVEDQVKIMWPFMSTLWEVALHNACAPTTQSGQRSAIKGVNMSKGVAHRAQNPGGQNAHTVLALLGQQDASSRDLHADHRAVEQPTRQRLRFPAILLGGGVVL